jgi:alpha-mannosidase
MVVKKIFAYAHTHWDREWYQPFETFRTYLVAVLRHILDDLEAGRLSCFYLDGQAIILEDALEIAPELGSRIAALMQEKKLAAGPWYVLPDEMLVCGESLVRNLKVGIACVGKFGDPSLIGYSPDTFSGEVFHS